MNQIKNRWDGRIICEGEESIKELAQKNRSNLSGSNLSGANLSWSNLSWADLSRANLSWADLSRADLSRANMSGAKIEFWQFPSIRLVSSIQLTNLPDNLQLELMRRDAFAHPHPEKFDEWARGGGCPYDDVERFWLFEPKRELWAPGLHQMTDRDLIVEICKSQGWKIKGYL